MKLSAVLLLLVLLLAACGQGGSGGTNPPPPPPPSGPPAPPPPPPPPPAATLCEKVLSTQDIEQITGFKGTWQEVPSIPTRDLRVLEQSYCSATAGPEVGPGLSVFRMAVGNSAAWYYRQTTLLFPKPQTGIGFEAAWDQSLKFLYTHDGTFMLRVSGNTNTLEQAKALALKAYERLQIISPMPEWIIGAAVGTYNYVDPNAPGTTIAIKLRDSKGKKLTSDTEVRVIGPPSWNGDKPYTFVQEAGVDWIILPRFITPVAGDYQISLDIGGKTYKTIATLYDVDQRVGLTTLFVSNISASQVDVAWKKPTGAVSCRAQIIDGNFAFFGQSPTLPSSVTSYSFKNMDLNSSTQYYARLVCVNLDVSESDPIFAPQTDFADNYQSFTLAATSSVQADFALKWLRIFPLPVGGIAERCQKLPPSAGKTNQAYRGPIAQRVYCLHSSGPFR